MATEILASGSNADTSDDFDVLDGDSANVFLKGVDGGLAPEMVFIEIKDDQDNYTPFASLGVDMTLRNVIGPGTFRVRRADALGRRAVGVCLG